ncbi:MAG: LamG-like jellyroll fold domain-containing protein [Candidatus Helarchaeota archaeon]
MPSLYEHTKLLLNLNGSDGDTYTTDASASNHSISFFGNAQLDTAYYKYGSASLYLPNSGSYLNTPQSNDFDFGTDDFTIEFWIRRNGNINDYAGVISTSSGTTNGWAIYFGNAGSGTQNYCKFVSRSGGWSDRLISDTILPDITWIHIAVCRDGNTLRMFQGGILVDSYDCTGLSFTDGSGNPVIGRIYTGTNGYYFTGHLDDLRVIKGSALYTEDFTPPTQELETGFLVNNNVELIYDNGFIVNEDVDLLYIIRDAVSNELNFKYENGENVNNDLEISYDISNAVSNELNFKYDNGEVVSNELEIVFNQSAYVSNTKPFYYFINGEVPKSLNFEFDIGSKINNILNFKYDLESYVSKSLNFEFDIGIEVNNDLNFEYDAGSFVNKILNYKYDAGLNVNNKLNFEYNLSAYINKSLKFIFGIRWDVYKQIRTLNNIFETVNNDLEVLYNIYSTIQNNLEYLYSIYEIINNDLSYVYEISQATQAVTEIQINLSLAENKINILKNKLKKIQCHNEQEKIFVKKSLKKIEFLENNLKIINISFNNTKNLNFSTLEN